MTTRAITASLYLRLSFDRHGDEMGVDRQRTECLQLIEREGWKLGPEFVDNNKSATTGKRRPGFEALIDSKPELVVMWSVDRLVRRGPDLERLIDLNIPVHSKSAGPMDLATASGRLNARLLTSVATFEGEMKAERMQAQHRQRVRDKRTFWPSQPFGIERDGSALVQHEADALRKAYYDLLAGVPLSALARQLNEAGHTTTFGKPWRVQTLRPVMLNARNAGIFVSKGQEIGKASWPEIVPESIFRAAVALLEDPKRQTNAGKLGPRRNLLTGMATCDVCDGRIRRSTVSGGRVKRGVYRCGDSHASADVEQLDGLVLNRATAKLDANDARQWTGQEAVADVDVSELQAQERAVQARMDSLGKLFMAGAMTEQAVIDGTEDGKARLAELRAKIAAAGAEDAAPIVDVELLYQAIDTMDVDKLRGLLQRVVTDVRLYRRGKGARELTLDFVKITFADGTTEGGPDAD